jgi:hypothetical protein
MSGMQRYRLSQGNAASTGLTDSEALRSRRRDHDVVLFAFDLIEHQGDDLRNAAGPQAATRQAARQGQARHPLQ